jgi:hypothetical protein
MEDEGFVDDSFIEETAWEYVGLHGRACLSVLRRLAEITERSGDDVSAHTWRAIAEAAESILGTDYGSDGIYRVAG